MNYNTIDHTEWFEKTLSVAVAFLSLSWNRFLKLHWERVRSIFRSGETLAPEARRLAASRPRGLLHFRRSLLLLSASRNSRAISLLHAHCARDGTRALSTSLGPFGRRWTMESLKRGRETVNLKQRRWRWISFALPGARTKALLYSLEGPLPLRRRARMTQPYYYC